MSVTTYDDVEYVLAEIITEATGEPRVGRFERTLAKSALVRLREVGLALPSPPADDTREALAAVLDDSLLCWTYNGTHTVFHPTMGADAVLARFEVRPYGTVTDAEVEWEYGVRHVAVDGWPTERVHVSLEDARADLDTCGMNCHLIRRRAAQGAGQWEAAEAAREARS